MYEAERELVMEVVGEDELEAALGRVMKDALGVMVETGEAIVHAPRTQDKLFVLLDLFDHFLRIKPLERGARQVREEMEELVAMVTRTARQAYDEAETDVANDASKHLALDGTVHQLTSNTMSYVRRLCEYQETIEILLGTRTARKGGASSDSLATNIVTIVRALSGNLEEKAKGYKKWTLSYLFLVNNQHYIAKALRSPHLLTLLGPKVARSYDAALEESLKLYWEASWTKTLSFVTMIQVKYTKSGDVSSTSKAALKHAFSGFNAALEEQESAQVGYAIPDSDLRSRIRAETRDRIVPLYAAFYARYTEVSFSKTHMDKYVKYRPEDVERILTHLFDDAP